MTPVKLCEKDVEIAVKMIQPQLVRVDLKNYKKNMLNVAKFLVKVKGNRKKWFLTMAVDYFNCLLTYHKEILKLSGFKMNQINSDLAKDLYIKFLEEKGSLYWGGIMEDSSITTDSGIIHREGEAEDMDMEVIKKRMKEKFLND